MYMYFDCYFEKGIWVLVFNILIENFIVNWLCIIYNGESFYRFFDNCNEYGYNFNKLWEGCKRFLKIIVLNLYGIRGKNIFINNFYLIVLGWFYRNLLLNKWFLFRLKFIYV